MTKKKLIIIIAIACAVLVAAAVVLVVVLTGKADVESISVKTNPTKTVYSVNEDFSSSGLVVSAHYSDGEVVDLEASEYTVDSSAFNKAKGGTYEIKVKLNDDETKTCSFKVTVKKVLKSISAKAGYDSKFIKGETVFIDEMNLVIIETYDDGSTAEVSGNDLDPYYVRINTVEFGENLKATVSSSKGLSCEITYSVVSRSSLTVKSFDLATELSATERTIAFQDRSQCNKCFSAVEFKVVYEEIPTREYLVKVYDVISIYSAVTAATEAGTYNVVFTYEGEKLQVPFTLVDVSSSTNHKISVDTSNIVTKYLKGEKVELEALGLENIPLIATYDMGSGEDIVVTYIPTLSLSANVEGLTDTAGKKTVTIKEGENDLCSYEIDVVEVVIEDGTYLRNYDMYYADGFKKNGDNYSFYTSGAYEDGYTFDYISRYISDGELKFLMYFKKDTKEMYIGLSGDGKLDDYVKYNSSYVKITMDIDGKKQVLFAADGKFGEEFVEMLSSYGDAHLDSKTGTLITDFSSYVFENDSTVYFVFEQQDATGQSFLGNYSGGYGYIVIEADGVNMYNSKKDYNDGKEPSDEFIYRFEVNGDDVIFTIRGMGKATLDSKTGVLKILDYGFTFTRETE